MNTIPLRRASAVTAAAIGALLLATGPGWAQDGAAVEVVDNAYEPETIEVEAGTTITWSHTGSLPHSVTASDGSFDSSPDCNAFGDPCMENGDTFEFTPTEAGEIAYYCKLHGSPDGAGMAGTIVVTAAGQDDAEETEEPADDGTDDTEEESDAEEESDTDGEAEVTGALEVSDQTGDGQTVTVDSVTIAGADGFVVVHADDDGAPGAVLGHAAVEEGTSTNVVVPFDSALTGDQTVWPMLHVDAGEAGVYEFPGADGPVTADGDVVVLPLAYTVAPADADTSDDTLAETGDYAWLLGLAGALAIVAGAGLLRRTRRQAT